MHPDLGCYEERYRLTRDARLGLVASLSVFVPLAISFFLMQGAFPGSVVFFVIAVVSALPAAVGLAIRQIAFRADHAGITLGDSWLLRRNRAVFIPWADVEQVIIYPQPDSRADSPAWSIGIQRRPGAPDLREGDEPAPGCPLPRVVAAATRPGSGWRLDRDRLAAVTAAVAPGIPVIDTSTGTALSVEGPGPG